MDGKTLHQLVARLYPVMRSITGDGVRESLAILSELAPLTIREVPSGTEVLDWEVPEEWVFREAYIENEAGTRLVDTADSTLQVVNYSTAVNAVLSRVELEPHLHTLPDQPDAIPYRTSYYERNWGFCLSENQLQTLGDGPFKVVIDAEHMEGSLTFGELVIPGESDAEVLVSTHICHPSLANDNLTGMVLSAALANHLQKNTPRLSWRFVFVPGTIGAITWLSRHRDSVKNIVGGLVLTGLGDDHDFTWKEPRTEQSWIDGIVKQTLIEHHPDSHAVIAFGPYGYDERQYCSPGFDLPVGRLTRGVHGTFPEYHTSQDNLDFISQDRLEESLALLIALADRANQDDCYQNLQPYGEPQLGRRGLYGSLGALNNPGDAQMAMLWVLNQSDGYLSLSDISSKAGLPFATVKEIAQLLEKHQLLKRLHHRVEG